MGQLAIHVVRPSLLVERSGLSTIGQVIHNCNKLFFKFLNREWPNFASQGLQSIPLLSSLEK